jgi:probable phosphoglycerate mutase
VTAGVPPRTGQGRRLVLVRHGQTAWNAEGRAQGHADVSLDDTGRAQAEEMAPVVAGYEPTLLLSSDLARARETAAFLEKATGLTAEEDPRLREYHTGARTGLTRQEFAVALGATDAEAADSWDAHSHIEAEGGESVEAVGERIVPALHDVLARLGEGETAVVVLHGAALRVAIAGVLGWPLGTNDALEAMRNCGWAVLREHGQNRLRLATYNQSAAGGPPDSRL